MNLLPKISLLLVLVAFTTPLPLMAQDEATPATGTPSAKPPDSPFLDYLLEPEMFKSAMTLSLMLILVSVSYWSSRDRPLDSMDEVDSLDE